MKKNNEVNIIFVLIYFALLTGYVLNIITIFDLAAGDGGITAMFIFRLFGILIPPIGTILGYM